MSATTTNHTPREAWQGGGLRWMCDACNTAWPCQQSLLQAGGNDEVVRLTDAYIRLERLVRQQRETIDTLQDACTGLQVENRRLNGHVRYCHDQHHEKPCVACSVISAQIREADADGD